MKARHQGKLLIGLLLLFSLSFSIPGATAQRNATTIEWVQSNTRQLKGVRLFSIPTRIDQVSLFPTDNFCFRVLNAQRLQQVHLRHLGAHKMIRSHLFSQVRIIPSDDDYLLIG